MDCDKLMLPKRTDKKRECGLTLLNDTGLGIRELYDIIESVGKYVDIIKFGVGSAYLTNNLKEKISILKENNIPVYFGGTLFEAFYWQKNVEGYKSFLHNLNINYLEISCGIVDLSLEQRIKYIDDFKKDFVVFAEVGTKDKEIVHAPSLWIDEIEKLLKAGVWKVVTEGRDSGTAGIFTSTGELRSDLLEEITMRVSVDKLIFEAPTEDSQIWFINKFGPNVNLGNISPYSVLVLETMRNGLRYDTFDLLPKLIAQEEDENSY